MLLEGVRVFEAGTGIATAYCGRVLRSLGAEVIKLEDPADSDWTRGYGAACETHPWAAAARCYLNGAKARAALDGGPGANEAAFERLLATGDVVIAGPGELGTMTSRACPATVSLVHIVAAVDPPAGFEVQPDESSGVAAGLRDPYGGPVPASGLRIDIAQANAGAHAAATAALALARRELGNGDAVRIEVGIYESAFSMIEIAAQNLLLQARFGGALPDLMTAARPPLRCRDGGLLAINLWGKEVWQRFCEVIGRPELAGDSRFIETTARYAHAEEVRAIMEAWCTTVDRDEAVDRLRQWLIPSAPILSFAESIVEPQLQARGLLVADGAHPGPRAGSCYVIDGLRDALPYSGPDEAAKILIGLGLPGLVTTVREGSDAVLVELR